MLIFIQENNDVNLLHNKSGSLIIVNWLKTIQHKKNSNCSN